MWLISYKCRNKSIGMELSVVTENLCLVAVLPFLVWVVAYEVLTSHAVMIHEALEQNVSFI